MKDKIKSILNFLKEQMKTRCKGRVEIAPLTAGEILSAGHTFPKNYIFLGELKPNNETTTFGHTAYTLEINLVFVHKFNKIGERGYLEYLDEIHAIYEELSEVNKKGQKREWEVLIKNSLNPKIRESENSVLLFAEIKTLVQFYK